MIIVEQQNGTWRIVHQPDHARVSGELAQRWRRPDAIPQAIWPRFVEAVRRHDDGWFAAETEPAIDQVGQPYDFRSLPTPHHLALWRRSIQHVGNDDLYQGVIVALHGRWLYTHVVEVSEPHAEAAQAFLLEVDQYLDASIEKLRAGVPALRQAVGPNELATARKLLGLFDAMSLMLIGALPADGFDASVPFGDREEKLTLTTTPTGITVAPWPFEEGDFEVVMPTRELAQQRFTGSADFAQKLAHATVRDVRYAVTSGD